MVLLSLSTKRQGAFGRHRRRRRRRREMYIPSEILIMVAEYLAQKDRKSLRLVSRDFH